MNFRNHSITLFSLICGLKNVFGFAALDYKQRFRIFQTRGVFLSNYSKNQHTIMQMASKKKNKYLENATIAMENAGLNNAGLGFNENSPKYIKIKPDAPIYKPKNKNQELYVQSLVDSKIKVVLGIGPAGCGKTLFAVYNAIMELKRGTVQKLIMTRPLVSVDKEDIGFLPGNIANKMDPWTRPIFDILLEFFSKKEIDTMLENGVIEISPLAYMRGRTFKNCWIIADEMQNSSPNQMLMMTTRLGLGSKIVITGDVNQSDRSDGNGLVDFMKKLASYDKSLEDNGAGDGIRLIQLFSSDVERSPVVSKILDIYESKPAVRKPSLKREILPDKSFDIDIRPTNKW